MFNDLSSLYPVFSKTGCIYWLFYSVFEYFIVVTLFVVLQEHISVVRATQARPISVG